MMDFHVGQHILHLSDCKVEVVTICKVETITIECLDKPDEVIKTYFYEDNYARIVKILDNSRLFATKQDLVDHLFKNMKLPPICMGSPANVPEPLFNSDDQEADTYSVFPD